MRFLTKADQLKWHYRNYNCKAILLGASHDNGYALPITELQTSGTEHKSIALIEGPPFAKELRELKSVQFFRWDTIFSNTRLDVRFPSPKIAQRELSPSTISEESNTDGKDAPEKKRYIPGNPPKTLKEAQAQLNRLSGKGKICYPTYTKKRCWMGENCKYVHDYDLTPLQMEALLLNEKQQKEKRAAARAKAKEEAMAQKLTPRASPPLKK